MEVIKLGVKDFQRFADFEKEVTVSAYCVSEFIESYGYDVYVARRKQQWIGYLIVHELNDKQFDIIHIVVQEAYRGRGIAHQLLHFFQKDARPKEVSLEVREDNDAAVRLYQSHQFDIVARRKRYYGDKDGVLMVKANKTILAIETSCDETSAAVVQSDYTILSNVIYTQKEHEKYGGVVPEVASREHVEKLPIIITEALNQAECEYSDLDYIAVTYGPGLAGSLMIGVEAAKTLGWQLELPVIPVNHMAGHIYANYDEGNLQYPLLSVTVSGGHTEIVELQGPEQFRILAQTHDDAIGEVYDKVARVLDLGYPGGPKVALLAESGEANISFPIAKVRDDAFGMSFSGLKTAVINYVHKHKQNNLEIHKADVAASFQDAVIRTLDEKLQLCLAEGTYKQIVLAGGVSANTRIREHIKQIANERGIHFTVPKSELCTDNAAMIGLAAAVQINNNIDITNDEIKIKPGLVLG